MRLVHGWDGEGKSGAGGFEVHTSSGGSSSGSEISEGGSGSSPEVSTTMTSESGGSAQTSPIGGDNTTTVDAYEEMRIGEVILDEYDEEPIREMCAKTSWDRALSTVIYCPSRVGGVGTSITTLPLSYPRILPYP